MTNPTNKNFDTTNNSKDSDSTEDVTKKPLKAVSDYEYEDNSFAWDSDNYQYLDPALRSYYD